MLGSTVLHFHPLRSTKVCVWGVPCYVFIHYGVPGCVCSAVPCYALVRRVPRSAFWGVPCYVVFIHRVLRCTFGTTVLRFHQLRSTEVFVLGVPCYTFILEYRRAFGSTVPHSINFGVPRCAFWEYRVTPSFRSTDVRLGVSCHIPSTSEYRGVSLGSTVLAPSFRSTEVYVWMYRATSLSTEYRDVRC